MYHLILVVLAISLTAIVLGYGMGGINTSALSNRSIGDSIISSARSLDMAFSSWRMAHGNQFPVSLFPNISTATTPEKQFCVQHDFKWLLAIRQFMSPAPVVASSYPPLVSAVAPPNPNFDAALASLCSNGSYSTPNTSTAPIHNAAIDYRNEFDIYLGVSGLKNYRWVTGYEASSHYICLVPTAVRKDNSGSYMFEIQPTPDSVKEVFTNVVSKLGNAATIGVNCSATPTISLYPTLRIKIGTS